MIQESQEKKEEEDLEELKKEWNYYKLFEITSESSHEEIRKSYQKLALKWHPDKGSSGDECFKLIKAVYKMLTEKSREGLKELYDKALSMGRGEFFAEKNFYLISMLENQGSYISALIDATGQVFFSKPLSMPERIEKEDEEDEEVKEREKKAEEEFKKLKEKIEKGKKEYYNWSTIKKKDEDIDLFVVYTEAELALLRCSTFSFDFAQRMEKNVKEEIDQLRKWAEQWKIWKKNEEVEPKIKKTKKGLPPFSGRGKDTFVFLALFVSLLLLSPIILLIYYIIKKWKKK